MSKSAILNLSNLIIQNGKTPTFRMAATGSCLNVGFFVLERSIQLKGRESLLRLRKDNKGNEGVVLFQEDLFIMQQLAIHQTLRSLSIHDLLQAYSPNGRNPNSITNRIGKLRAAGILVALREKPVDVRGALYIYHYKLGIRGVDALVDMGILNEEEGDRLKQSLAHIRAAPSRHKRCLSHVVNQTFLRCHREQLMDGAIHERGSTHPLFSTSQVSNGIVPEIIPDWVFEKGDTVICIEMDTGSQNTGVLLKKSKRYLRQAEKLRQKGKQLIVIYSVADGSVPGEFSTNRERRIAAIKELVPPMVEWPGNLDFYAVPASRTPSLVQRIFEYIEPATSADRMSYAEDWYAKAADVLRIGFDVRLLNMEDVLVAKRNRDMDCQLIMGLRPLRRDAKWRKYLVIYGEEGAVRTFQYVRANAIRAKELDESGSTQILVVYAEIENMQEEIYQNNTTASIDFTSMEDWVHAMNNEEPAPETFTFTSKRSRERRLFDGALL